MLRTIHFQRGKNFQELLAKIFRHTLIHPSKSIALLQNKNFEMAELSLSSNDHSRNDKMSS